MDECQAVMRQWLAFLQAGRSWQRQAANMAARSDLAAGGLGSLLREAAPGQRPSAQEIVLLLGAGRLAPGVGAKQGVEQRFNSLPRPGRKQLFRQNVIRESENQKSANRESGNLENQATKNIIPKNIILKDKIREKEIFENEIQENEIQKDIISENTIKDDLLFTENFIPKGLGERTEFNLAEAEINTQPGAVARAKAEEKIWGKPPDLAAAKSAAAAENMAEVLSAVPVLLEEATADWSGDLPKPLPTVNFVQQNSEILPEMLHMIAPEWDEPAAEVAERAPEQSPAADWPAPGADVEALADLVAEKLRDDIEILLGSSSLI